MPKMPQGHAFAPDSLVLNRKLPLWYQVSQSLRASILGLSLIHI